MESNQSLEGLVDLDHLTRWMDAQGLESGPIRDAERLGGGTQNILMRFTRGARAFVLRRPPARTVADGAKIMLREAQLLGALRDSDVPHPHLIAHCPDETIIGAAFYLMEPVDGFNPTVSLPDGYRDLAWQEALGFSMVDAILRLARVDYEKAGLSSLARLDNYLERQAGRWRGQLEGYKSFRGWPGAESLPGWDEVGAWLDAHVPGTLKPGIVHGDYHLSNVMFRSDRPEIAAIIDWELGSIGDPLLDLGWLVATWPDRHGGDTGSSISVPGASNIAAPADLVARYGAETDRDMEAFPWYAILACYKLGILQEGSHARACAGAVPEALGALSNRRARAMMRRAQSFIDAVENRGGLFH